MYHSLFSLHSFSVDDVSLPVHLDHYANLPVIAVPSDNLNLTILLNGHRWNAVLLSQRGGEDMIFFWIWEDAPKYHLWSLLWSEVTKGPNFILVATQHFFFRHKLTHQPVNSFMLLKFPLWYFRQSLNLCLNVFRGGKLIFSLYDPFLNSPSLY